jgi:hypothetical protein
MTDLISLLDQENNKIIGEKGHISEKWSKDINEKTVQLYFQLVRNMDENTLTNEYNEIMDYIKENNDYELLEILYCLIGQTRDIENGKGEYVLAYKQLFIFYERLSESNEELANNLVCFMLKCFVKIDDVHSYGCWKDIKNWCNIFINKYRDENHKMIKYCINLYINQINDDLEKMKNHDRISLMSKWIPREKTKYGWLFKEISKSYYKEIIIGGMKTNSEEKSKIKCYTLLRKTISKLNNYLETVQIKMCNKEWHNINFKKVTSLTMQKQKKSFMNINKDGKERYENEDRKLCSLNLSLFLDKMKKGEVSIKGKRCNIYDFVNDSLRYMPEMEKDIINGQWSDYMTQMKKFRNLIPMCDTSASMEKDNCIPLYNAMGLSIAISENNSDEFKDRIMTFSNTPSWINLSEENNFVDKVKKIRTAEWGMNTNFYRGMDMILDTIVKHGISPDIVEDMVLVILSDMQIDTNYGKNHNNMMEEIEERYKKAGLKSKYNKEYNTPHILFWNLSQTNNFPTTINKKNVTMISGYSPVILNKFCDGGFISLKDLNPFNNLLETLNNKRYNILKEYFKNETNEIMK